MVWKYIQILEFDKSIIYDFINNTVFIVFIINQMTFYKFLLSPQPVLSVTDLPSLLGKDARHLKSQNGQNSRFKKKQQRRLLFKYY